MSNLAERLVAVEKTHGVSVDFLGVLTWYTITDCRVTREQLKDIFEQVGLDTAHLPNPINVRDAFRRASKSAEVKGYQLEKGKYLNLMVRQVSMNRTSLTVQVVREVVNSQRKRLEYTPVAELTLRKEALSIVPMIPEADLLPVETQQLDLLPREYELAKEHYNGNNIRELVGRILGTCSPVAVRQSGGVYFVPLEHQEKVQALQAFVRELKPFALNGRYSTMWTLPVVDAEEQREMLQESLEEQVEAAANSLIREMTDHIKAGKKTTVAVVSSYANRIKGLKNLVAEYEEMLETKTDAARSNLEIVSKQAAKLLEMIEA